MEQGFPIFRNYLEDEDDKPYFTVNSLAYYYEDMERKQKLITDMSKLLLGYDTKLNVNLEEMEKRIAAELGKWDGKVEELPETVNDLLTQWVEDGSLTALMDTTLLDKKADISLVNTKADASEVNTLTAQLVETSDTLNKRLDVKIIESGAANAQVTDALVSTTKNKSFSTLRNRLEENEKNLQAVGAETDIMKTAEIVNGSRITLSGSLMADANAFRTELIPVTVGERVASVSTTLSALPTYAFYNSATIASGSFISSAQARDATVPAGATHMLIWYVLVNKAGFIVQKLASGFPTLGQDTFIYKNIYKKSEAYNKNDVDSMMTSNTTAIKQKLDIDTVGQELNILKIRNVTLIDGSRVNNSGDLLSDATTFRTNTVPVTAGERYASVSSNTGNFPRYAFYSSDTISAANFISFTAAREAIVPAGATRMVFSGALTLKDSYIVMKMASGYPIVGQNTFKYNNLYEKSDVDAKLSAKLEENDLTKWYPDAFGIEIITVETNDKVLAISKTDVLYGTDGFRNIFKATKYDLSDKVTVCTLKSGSTLQKLLFLSPSKAVGYVRSSVSSDEGFYCFDNADTTVWTARRVGVMLAGSPALELQSLIKAPNGYVYSCSYGIKVTDPNDTTTEAPRHVYRSKDAGETWQVIYTHPVRLNTHIHCIEWDNYRGRLWVCVGDEGLGGMPGWAYSDNYGDTFSFVENNDATGQIPFMDTAIIPTRRYVLFGSDHHPAGIRKWMPKNDIKNPVVSNADVTNAYMISIPMTNNFGFARNPVIDMSVYPYKIAMVMSHNDTYSKSALLVSPNFKDWYMVDFVDTPLTVPSWTSLSGITSDGWVLGWCTYTNDGKHYYRRFKFPGWVAN